MQSRLEIEGPSRISSSLALFGPDNVFTLVETFPNRPFFTDRISTLFFHLAGISDQIVKTFPNVLNLVTKGLKRPQCGCQQPSSLISAYHVKRLSK